MRVSLFVAVCLLLAMPALVQAQDVPVKKLQAALSLHMPDAVEEDMPGTRGAAVAWHPVLKYYYAVFAGNAAYPLAVFNATGKMVKDGASVASVDVRGMWYHAASKRLMTNGYDDFGWHAYKLNAAGLPTDTVGVFAGLHQPTPQSAGAYYAPKDEVWFVDYRKVMRYSHKTGTESGADKRTELLLGTSKAQAKKEAPDADALNERWENDYSIFSLAVPGTKGAELGLLNKFDRRIELYDAATGYMVQVLQLPDSVVLPSGNFGFAWANGYYWLFNEDERTWVGYK